MFELPNAKRVKRSKLFSSFSSSESEADDKPGQTAEERGFNGRKAESRSNSRKHQKSKTDNSNGEEHSATEDSKVDYGFDYEFVDMAAPSGTSTQGSQNVKLNVEGTTHAKNEDASIEAKEESYAFHLFAPKPKPPTSATTTTTKTDTTPDPQSQTQPQAEPTLILIRSPTPSSDSLSTGGILKPRPSSYYFTTSTPSDTLKSEYALSAITPSTLDKLSTQSWPGTHLPWRIINIPTPKLTLIDPSLISLAHVTTSKAGRSDSMFRRARPSKKRRIQLRHRVQARVLAKVAGERKEVEDREKRTRRNREKKVKRKMREKAKKGVVVEGVGEGDAGMGSEAELG